MGQFTIEISAVGPNTGCDRLAQPGDKLHNRCGKLTCLDCVFYDFIQNLRQRGVAIGRATMTHRPGMKSEVVDDLLHNVRRSGTY